MNKPFTEEFNESGLFDGKFILPPELIERFNTIECLSSNELGETYLLSEKDGSERFVLKCYQKLDTESKIGEMDFLSELNHKNLPKYDTAIQTEDNRYVLHQYVDGVPLCLYVEECEKISEAQAIGIVLELCDALSYLHSRPVPIIHRDIKPSNIVINPADNSVTLIDFGISRRFSENSETDTYNFGTRKYAAPEQYGFSQTDCRSDIFSLGVVLRFMLTGSPDGEVQNKSLDEIIKKCTAFSPKDRYQSAEALKQVLIKYKNRTWQKVARGVVFVFTLFLALVVGFSVGRNTEFLKAPPAEPKGYVFKEPLIEKAVRLMLNIPDGQPVTQNDLDSVIELFIGGNQAVRTADEVNIIGKSNEGKYGVLSRLDDLREMKNLRQINFSGQSITDLSPLADCKMLSSIDIVFCPITDLSPLASLNVLHQMNIMGTSVCDFSPLDNIASFRLLWIDGNMEQYLDTLSRDDIEVMVDGMRVNNPPVND